MSLCSFGSLPSYFPTWIHAAHSCASCFYVPSLLTSFHLKCKLSCTNWLEIHFPENQPKDQPYFLQRLGLRKLLLCINTFLSQKTNSKSDAPCSCQNHLTLCVSPSTWAGAKQEPSTWFIWSCHRVELQENISRGILFSAVSYMSTS